MLHWVTKHYDLHNQLMPNFLAFDRENGQFMLQTIAPTTDFSRKSHVKHFDTYNVMKMHSSSVEQVFNIIYINYMPLKYLSTSKTNTEYPIKSNLDLI